MQDFKVGDLVTINGENGKITTISANGKNAYVELDDKSAPTMTVRLTWLEKREPTFKIGDQVKILVPMVVTNVDQSEYCYAVGARDASYRNWFRPSDLELVSKPAMKDGVY